MVAVFKAASPLSDPELCLSSLQGLSQAMKLPSPAYHLWSLLRGATEKIFDLLPNKIRVRNKNIYIPDNLCLGFSKAFLAKQRGVCFKTLVGRLARNNHILHEECVCFQDLNWGWIFRTEVLSKLRCRLTSAAPGSLLLGLLLNACRRWASSETLTLSTRRITGPVVRCTVHSKWLNTSFSPRPTDLWIVVSQRS